MTFGKCHNNLFAKGDLMVCTFFGHHNVSDDVEQKIASVLIDLIENKGVTDFYVGNQGRFLRQLFYFSLA